MAFLRRIAPGRAKKLDSHADGALPQMMRRRKKGLVLSLYSIDRI